LQKQKRNNAKHHTRRNGERTDTKKESGQKKETILEENLERDIRKVGNGRTKTKTGTQPAKRSRNKWTRKRSNPTEIDETIRHQTDVVAGTSRSTKICT